MKEKITYWKGVNLGEGRKRFMKENLRLKEIPPEVGEIERVIKKKLGDITLGEFESWIEDHKHSIDIPKELAKAIINKLKG